MVREEKINIYKFEELNKEIQEEVIENQRQTQSINYLDLDWWEENLIENLGKIGFYDIKLRYSLGYCQGDGFSFIGKLDLMKFLSVNKIKTKMKPLLKAIENEEISLNMYKNHYATHYQHSNTIDLDLCYDYIDLNDKQKELKDKLEEFIQDFYNTFCKNSEHNGYEIIEYEQSDKNIKEIIDINDYEYTSTGKIY